MTHSPGERRQIPRLPDVPDMDAETIADLTELVFLSCELPAAADLVFVFGSGRHPELVASRVRDLLDRGIATKVVVAGGAPKYEDSKGNGVAESTRIIDMVGPARYPGVEFLGESASWNIRENVAFAVEGHDLRGIRSIVFVIPAHGACRGYCTLRGFFPDADLCVAPYVAPHEEESAVLSAEQWHLSENGRRRVWGEFLRLLAYDAQGDLDLGEFRDPARRIAERHGIDGRT